MDRGLSKQRLVRRATRGGCLNSDIFLSKVVLEVLGKFNERWLLDLFSYALALVLRPV